MLSKLALLVLMVFLMLQLVSSGRRRPRGLWWEPELLEGVGPCRCVDIRRCGAILELLRRITSSQGSSQEELNYLKRNTCGFRGFVPFVCCTGEVSLESRINFTPNIIGNGNSQGQHKTSLSSDYVTQNSPDHSSDLHHSFTPNPTSYPDSKIQFQQDDFTESFSLDDIIKSPDFKTQYSHEETSNRPSVPYFANHPPHVHRKAQGHSASSQDHSVDTMKHWGHSPRQMPKDTSGPKRCRASTTKIPINVSVFSRSGARGLREFDPKCDDDDDDDNDPRDETDNYSEHELEVETAATSPGVRLLPGEQCGITVEERIVGGKAAELGAFPWIARIGYTRNGSISTGFYLYRCGGSLINERYVLTAAHCVVNLPGGLQLATVRLGEQDERQDPDCQSPGDDACADPVQDFTPEVVHVHPEYDDPRYCNDLALIRLDRPARLSTYVSPICLPMGELALKNYTGLKATVAGWGAYQTGLQSSSPILQWLRLGVVDTKQCAAAYERTEVYIDGWRQLCAGGTIMEDSCDGDSGGPLMRPEQRTPDSFPQYFLVGVVSFGAKACGTENMPGVYTRVAAYLSWILDMLRP